MRKLLVTSARAPQHLEHSLDGDAHDCPKLRGNIGCDVARVQAEGREQIARALIECRHGGRWRGRCRRGEARSSADHRQRVFRS
ncbi:MAG: hypothetical protein ACRETZ_02140 [Steroidobacteraceae bacterium]